MPNYDDEYYKKYQDLQMILEEAYLNIYALQVIEKYNEAVLKGGGVVSVYSYNILGHICELIKVDLCMCIWKLYSDNSPRVNSIKALKSYITNNFKETIDRHFLPKTNLPPRLREAEKKANCLRNKYLAHLDADRPNVSVSVCDLVSIVEELRGFLDALCYKCIDERVDTITDEALRKIETAASLGLGIMIQRSRISE